MPTTLIRDATLITMNDAQEVLPGGSLLVRDGDIAAVLPAGSPLPAADRVIDGRGLVALPGLVNAHTHVAMTLLRGYADDLELMTWLQQRIWPLEMKLTEEDVYWGTMLGIVEMLRAGVTTFNDMYHYPAAAARAARESGIRACISGVLLGFLPNADDLLEKAEHFIRDLAPEADGRVRPMLAPHAPYTCPDPMMAKVIEVAAATRTPVHIHLSETATEVEESLRNHGETPVQHMARLGLFDAGHVLAAHCVHVTDADIALLAEKRVGVSHNPGSNMKLASGTAPLPKMLAAGVIVGLGTDGPASNNNLDILEETRLAALLHKLIGADPTLVPAQQALALATRGGAAALGMGDRIGQLTPGRRADVALIDVREPHLHPPHNLVSHLVYSARAGDVRTVLVDGVPLLLDGELQGLDQEKIVAEADACAARLVRAA